MCLPLFLRETLTVDRGVRGRQAPHLNALEGVAELLPRFVARDDVAFFFVRGRRRRILVTEQEVARLAFIRTRIELRWYCPDTISLSTS